MKTFSTKQRLCDDCECDLLYTNEFKTGLCKFCIEKEIERDNRLTTINQFEHTLQTTHLDNPTIICLLRCFIADHCNYEDIDDLIKKIDKEDF